MIETLFAKDSSSNTFLIKDDVLAVIDPGFQFSTIEPLIQSQMYTQLVLINTHCHYDHVCDDEKMLNHGFKLNIHGLDADAVEKPVSDLVLNPLFGTSFEGVVVERRLADGDYIDLGGVELEVLHTPGHTPGCICLFEKKSKNFFTGDTVFVGGVGRTDLSGGDFMDLKKSLSKIEEFAVSRGVEKYFPGHGPAGDIDDLLEVCKVYG